MPDSFVRTRCAACGEALGFDDWSRGSRTCARCGPVVTRDTGNRRQATERARLTASAEAYERLLDDIPDELVEELVAALEAEAAKSGPAMPVLEVLEELGVGRTPRERHWAAWGFAGGFAANIALAKWAQMSTGAPLSDFVLPMLLGGALAGLTCGAIGWGFAKLHGG